MTRKSLVHIDLSITRTVNRGVENDIKLNFWYWLVYLEIEKAPHFRHHRYL